MRPLRTPREPVGRVAEQVRQVRRRAARVHSLRVVRLRRAIRVPRDDPRARQPQGHRQHLHALRARACRSNAKPARPRLRPAASSRQEGASTTCSSSSSVLFFTSNFWLLTSDFYRRDHPARARSLRTVREAVLQMVDRAVMRDGDGGAPESRRSRADRRWPAADRASSVPDRLRQTTPRRLASCPGMTSARGRRPGNSRGRRWGQSRRPDRPDRSRDPRSRSTVAAATAAHVPRQPAWIAAATRCRRSAIRIGTQSATRTDAARDGSIETIASASDRSTIGMLGLTTRTVRPCTCRTRRMASASTPRTVPSRS